MTIVVLQDTTGDGRADKTEIFAEGLFIPTAIEPGDGGCYVGQSTDCYISRTPMATVRPMKNGSCCPAGLKILITPCTPCAGGMMGGFTLINPLHSQPLGNTARRRAPEEWRHHVAPARYAGGRHRTAVGAIVGTPLHATANPSLPMAPDFRASATPFPGRCISPMPAAGALWRARARGIFEIAGPEIVDGPQFPKEYQGQAITRDFRAHRIVRFNLSENGAATPSIGISFAAVARASGRSM